MLVFVSVADERPIPLCQPWFDEHEQERVRRALAGRTAGDGPFGRQVEKRLAEILDVPRVLLTTSCTHAMELALLALGVGPGDEVVCPSFTFVSTAGAALRVGARPVFADIEPRTLGLDPADVERRLTPRTRAILPVHYGGIAPDMDALLDLARARRLTVVEDAAQGLGARYRGRPVGALGDAGCFSFHETKNLTCGEGGALALRDADVIARAEIAREKGTNRHAFLRGEVDKYTWVAEGSSYVLSDLLAAVLDAQLDKASAITSRRMRIFERYRSELSEWAEKHGVALPPVYSDREGNAHIFYLLFRSPADRDRAMAALKARGVGATFHYVPLHSSPKGAMLHQGGELPVTDRVASTLLRLPLYPSLSDADVARVVSGVRGSLS
jgi:dTDP-4-amino-4,6-dideoxygalactose transaminase